MPGQLPVGEEGTRAQGPAALVLDRDGPVAQPNLRDRPFEPRAVQVIDVGGAAEQELVGARLEQEARPVQAADRGGVLGSTSARLVAGFPERGRLLVPDRRHAGQEVVDDGQLGLRVSADLRRALVADARHGCLDTSHALRHELDDDAPAVGRIGDAAHIAGLLEAVDHAGDRAGRQAREVGQHAGGRRAAVEEHLERLDIGLGQAEPEGHRVAEQRPLEVDAAQGAEDGIDRFAVHG